jgi:hypothetical protein
MLFLLATLGAARAWSFKEHVMLTEVAAMRLVAAPSTPEGLRSFLSKALARSLTLAEERDYYEHMRVASEGDRAATLEWHATAPDLVGPDAMSRWGVPLKKLHYIDLELFHPTIHTYQPDLSALPALKDVPRDAADPRWAKAGMVPFGVEDAVARMTDALAHGDTVHAIEAAGELAHYAQDNTQPHHSTVDFRSLSYFGGNGPDVHAAMESLGSDLALSPERRGAVFDAFVAALDGPFPKVSADPWVATVEVAQQSYRCLPTIGEEAVASTSDGVLDIERFYAGPVLTLKAHQMAWAVQRTEVLWISAWNGAHR